jgi:hypothetical protein
MPVNLDSEREHLIARRSPRGQDENNDVVKLRGGAVQSEANRRRKVFVRRVSFNHMLCGSW